MSLPYSYKVVYNAKEYECIGPDVDIVTDKGVLNGVLLLENRKFIFIQWEKLDKLLVFDGYDKDMNEVYKELSIPSVTP